MCKTKQKTGELLRAPSSMGVRNFDASRRGKKGLKSFHDKKGTYPVVRRGDKSPINDLGSDIRLGSDKEKENVRT